MLWAPSNNLNNKQSAAGAFAAESLIFGTSRYNEVPGYAQFVNANGINMTDGVNNFGFVPAGITLFASNGFVHITGNGGLTLEEDVSNLIIDANGTIFLEDNDGVVNAQGVTMRAKAYTVGATPTPGFTGSVTFLTGIVATPSILTVNNGIVTNRTP